jgi:hypothetical protein
MALPLADVIAVAESLEVSDCRERDSGEHVSLLRELSSIE